MTETGEPTNRIPLRIKHVGGETVPAFPDECEPHTKSPGRSI